MADSSYDPKNVRKNQNNSEDSFNAVLARARYTEVIHKYTVIVFYLITLIHVLEGFNIYDFFL